MRGILHAFVDNTGHNDRRLYPQPTDPFAPWKLVTGDKALATAVGHELKRVGVNAEALWEIGVSSEDVVHRAMATFSQLFNNLIMLCKLDDTVVAAVKTTAVRWH